MNRRLIPLVVLMLAAALLPVVVAPTPAVADDVPFLRAIPWDGCPATLPDCTLNAINGYENEVDKFRFRIEASDVEGGVTVTWAGDIEPDAVLDGAGADGIVGFTTFEWNPGEATGSDAAECLLPNGDLIVGRCYWITVTATDSSGQSTSVDVYLRLWEDDQPLVIDGVPAEVTVEVGSILSFTASAFDPDIPQSGTLYEWGVEPYDPVLPAGVSIGLTTGLFSWAPTADQIGDHELEISARNEGGESGSVDVLIHVVGPSDPPTVIRITEAIGVDDRADLAPPLTIRVVETVAVIDDARLSRPVLVRVVESVVVDDGIRVAPPVTIRVIEMVAVSDRVAAVPPISIEVVESVGVSDTVRVPLAVVIRIGESVTVDEMTGVTPEPLASISGTVWADLDGDGLRDPFESTIDGVTVFADLDLDGILDAAEPWADSGPGGAYRLVGLLPGTVRVRQVVPAGYDQTHPGAGASFVHTVALAAGDEVDGRDFGNRATVGDSAPRISGIESIYVVTEGDQLTVVPEVVDAEGDPYLLTWDGVPDGAVINAIFVWTPTESQGPGEYVVTASAAQVDAPDLTTSQMFTVVVEEVDGPPVTATIAEGVVDVNSVEAGGPVMVSAAGLAPGTAASILLYSNPVKLASVGVGDDGTFTAAVTIPPDTAPGLHRIVVVGLRPDGEGRVTQNHVVVVPTTCTTTGTPGDDILRGTSGDDVICGLGGNDVLLGLGGDDVLVGGLGGDRLVGGSGDDVLVGGPGADLLFGGRGSDVLEGGPGDDSLAGGPDDDVVVAPDGADRLWNPRGSDEVVR